MGAVTDFPRDIVLALARANNTDRFVETGTYHGATARWAIEHFKEVHTIERSSQLYRELGPIPGVVQWCGDSRELLPRLVAGWIKPTDTAVFWFDAHWDGQLDTAGADDQCPLLGELPHATADDIILIDDARLFVTTPPPPFDPAQWPTLDQVVAALPKGMFIQIKNDIIFAMPWRLSRVWSQRYR